MVAAGDQQDLYCDGCWDSTGFAQRWLQGINRISTVMAAGDLQDLYIGGCR